MSETCWELSEGDAVVSIMCEIPPMGMEKS